MCPRLIDTGENDRKHSASKRFGTDTNKLYRRWKTTNRQDNNNYYLEQKSDKDILVEPMEDMANPLYDHVVALKKVIGTKIQVENNEGHMEDRADPIDDRLARLETAVHLEQAEVLEENLLDLATKSQREKTLFVIKKIPNELGCIRQLHC
ncbi:hypothetical protein CHS0354_039657 [Potamilus streckersoni]|uniref:Uncharacterized protein n=1 Tax=Potamilus streckersoni TaxID=2493646 RepID=A0AAE0SJR1_9BIVA|nr:hypothetical protein CHS0354_039657 [Potamilus streckersoni]